MNDKLKDLNDVRCNLCGSEDTRLLIRKEPFSYVQCEHCGLIYVNPRLRDLTGWHQRRYKKGRNGRGIQADVYRQFSPERMARMAQEVKKYDTYRRENRMLDVGCSAGAFLAAARREGWEGIGVDVSGASVRGGRERESLDIRIGTLREASFPDDYFDVVRMNNLLEHLPDPLSDLREVWRILRPNGLLVLATINGSSLAAWLSGPAWRYYDPYCHVYVFTPNTLRKMLQRARFRRVTIDTHGFRLGKYREGQLRLSKFQKFLAFAAKMVGRGHRLRATAKKIPHLQSTKTHEDM